MNLKAAITIDEIRDSLKRSGYLLEVRVESRLQNQGYVAEANSAYTDPDSGKSRELDISAIGGRKAGPEDFDWMFPVVLVECVNNSQPIAFITKVPIVSALHSEQVRCSGLPVKIRDFGRQNAWTGLGDYLGVEKFHHYCKGRVATQFCSFSKKRGSDDWLASHEDAHFSAFATLCHAIEHAVDDPGAQAERNGSTFRSTIPSWWFRESCLTSDREVLASRYARRLTSASVGLLLGTARRRRIKSMSSQNVTCRGFYG
jgi:hypothetical protein